jgi:hypothetical protein
MTPAVSRAATLAGAAVAALSLFAVPAEAGTTSGSSNGLTWTASSTIIGQTGTGTAVAVPPGNPIYNPSRPVHNGVVALIMEEPGGTFICSGSLLSDRRSVLTAGHCVSGGAGTPNPTTTTAWFYGGPNADEVVPFSPNATPVEVSDYFVNPDYTGEVIDENDIAVVRLSELAPEWATSYGLYTGPLEGQVYDIAGYGGRSTTGGDVGVNLGTGRLRAGENRYDFRLGDDDFGGFFTPEFFEEDPGTLIGNSWLADFDHSGFSENDASCAIAGAFGLGGPKYCNTGVGDLEVSTAGGDSGGPQFVDGRISSVTSYGLTFGSDFGDIDNALNDSFGEFNGFVPVNIHLDFIRSAMVPEPATWALMIGGFALVGGTLRRRRTAAA